MGTSMTVFTFLYEFAILSPFTLNALVESPTIVPLFLVCASAMISLGLMRIIMCGGQPIFLAQKQFPH